MSHPLIDKIVNEGVGSVNVSMLSQELRHKLMTEAGHTLLHQAKYKEAAQALAMAENKEELREQGRWLLQQQKLGLAAHFLVHVERRELLEELAQRCMATGELEAAQEIYVELGDETMLAFLRENF